MLDAAGPRYSLGEVRQKRRGPTPQECSQTVTETEADEMEEPPGLGYLE